MPTQPARWMLLAPAPSFPGQGRLCSQAGSFVPHSLLPAEGLEHLSLKTSREVTFSLSPLPVPTPHLSLPKHPLSLSLSPAAIQTWHLLRSHVGTSLAVQWVRIIASTAGGMGSIPGRGTKIPHAARCGQNNNNNNNRIEVAM